MTENSAKRKVLEPRLSSRKTTERVPDLPPEIQSSGWNFGDHHRQAFRDINQNSDARASFNNLTSCSRPISQSRLLLSLVAEAESLIGYRMTGAGAVVSGSWGGWEKWTDKWNGLRATAKSLKRLAAKMERHISLSDRGPVALPLLVGEPEETERYTASHMASRRLDAIEAQLRESAAEIEAFCASRKEWLKKLPRKKRRDLIARERLVMFVRFIEHETGEPHYEDVAILLSTVRWSVVTSHALPFEPSDNVSSDLLRKLSKRFTTPMIDRMYPNS